MYFPVRKHYSLFDSSFASSNLVYTVCLGPKKGDVSNIYWYKVQVGYFGIRCRQDVGDDKGLISAFFVY